MPEFSAQPGMRERLLRRVQDNPLFPEKRRWVTQMEVNLAQRDDLRDRERFIVRLRKTIEAATALPANADSQRVLDLKEELDRLYQAASTLPGETGEFKQAIHRLVEVIMKAVRAGAGQDTTAQRKLAEEDAARAEHYRLQDLALVADLMHEDSPIKPAELAPCLLGAEDDEFEAALGLFGAEQLEVIFHQAEQRLQQIDPARTEQPRAWAHLERLAAVVAGPAIDRTAQ